MKILLLTKTDTGGGQETRNLFGDGFWPKNVTPKPT